MGYYDSVKDDVKDKNKNASSGDGKGNFDTLKQNASEETEQKEDDDTPIEVLDEGLDNSRRRKSRSSSSSNNSSSSSGNSGGSGFPPTNDSDVRENTSADTSGLEEKLDKIIEQNARMIDILESFGN